ncbi:pyruvate dehydrogenase E1 component subunit alpha domain protein [Leptospira santarosai serovar Shermani str. 1342KT]|nr:pyruvate dehydrogenase E1 component subunit alpha domain protein [Leptospira santarosai serovar Shermani str. 1342KT]
MEISTYRFRGHSMSDPAKYRTKEELDRYKKSDPLLKAKDDLLHSEWKEEELEKLDIDIQTQVEESIRFADQSEEPPLGWLYKNVYAEDV